MSTQNAVDWSAYRTLFPALDRCTYLNTANGGPVSTRAAAAARGYYEEAAQYGDLATDRWAAGVESTRSRVAKLINASPDEVGFVPNTSMSIVCASMLFEGSGAVLTGATEHPTITTPWFARNYRVDVAQPESDGRFTVDAYARALRPDTRVIAVSHVRYNDGQVNDLEGLGELARAHGAHLVVDAIQSVGILPVRTLDTVDVLGFAGFKWLNAGHGCGVLYIRRGLIERYGLPIAGNRSRRTAALTQIDALDPLLEARAFELGTTGIPNLLALGASLQMLEEIGAGAITWRVGMLIDRLRAGLRSLQLRTSTDTAAEQLTPIVSAYVPNPQQTVTRLQERGINISLRSDRVRIAVSWHNNEADIDRCLHELERALAS